MTKSCLALGIALWLCTGTSHADFSISGRFLYADREFGLNGLTGVETNRPIRLADVQVFDVNSMAVLATGRTDLTGNFTLQVTDGLTRTIGVRAMTASFNTPDLHLTVRRINGGPIFAVTHPTGFLNHAPNDNIDFTTTPVIATPSTHSPFVERAGDPFNIFDVCLDGLDVVAALHGSRPGPLLALTVEWALGTDRGTYFSQATRTIHLLGLATDSDGYDDSVILHELGHYVEFNLARSDNVGGNHTPDACLNLQLAWSEGYGTFFQNVVRRFHNLSRPDIYVDTTGATGPGGVLIAYGVETLPFIFDPGSGNEVSVNAVLWDIVDDAATADNTPGTDDDNIQIADGPARFWDVFVNHLPLATSISIEDFWDGWFERGHGLQAQMNEIFSQFRMEFFDDAFEDDDTAATARDVGLDGDSSHLTLYGPGDQDWSTFLGVQGGQYLIQVSGLPCGSATRIDLLDDDATTVLRSNSSTINWTATKIAPLYLRVTRPGIDAYANYDLNLTFNVTSTVTTFQASEMDAGVLLAWETVTVGEPFMNFNVERSTTVSGPFERRNVEPVLETAPSHFEFLDTDVVEATRYFYRIVGVTASGEKEFGPISIAWKVPPRMVLHPVQPNPFNPNATLRFELPTSGPVFLRIYDMAGRWVRTLVNGETLGAGPTTRDWDGRDHELRDVASGVYLVRLDALGKTQVQRGVLVR